MADFLPALAARLVAVDGVEGVVLGGTHRGTHRPGSDYDAGLYHRDALDVEAGAAVEGTISSMRTLVAATRRKIDGGS